jgi:hypothetical protein
LRAAKAVTPEVVEVGRGELEQLARAWFRPRWEAREQALWKPLPAGVALTNLVESVTDDLSRLASPDEVTHGEYMYQARDLLPKAVYPNASGKSIETLAQYMSRGDVAALDVARRRYGDGALHHTLAVRKISRRACGVPRA